jgi:16S rRNA (cytosine967-C5)-methyltransferase
MIRILEATYGEEAPALMLANNERAPMALRVNLCRIDPARYCQVLDDAGLAWRRPTSASAAAASWGSETVILEQPVPSSRLPGYAAGLVSIQDAGAQLAAAVVSHDLNPDQAQRPAASKPRLLDACAAPGGKLFHLLERFPSTIAVALDSSPARMAILDQEGRRLGHTHHVGLTGDAGTHSWWDGAPFDMVFLDAPCSGSGTLRRHPDIKVLRQAGDLVRYAALQATLLRSLWQVLRPGGTLVYCTCSLFPAENDVVVEGFLTEAPDATIERFGLPTGRPMRMGWQLLPMDADTDGFYFARIRKDLA